MKNKKNDEGAVAIIAAVVMSFLCLALLSLVIDVGQVFEERRQLQNGADAAAVAVAQEYLTNGESLGLATAEGIAKDLSNRNARDTTGDIYGVYGTPWGTTGPHLKDGYDPPPADYDNYVEVRTKTKSSGGSVLPFFFSAGGSTITAVGRASWGFPSGARALAATISGCEWNLYTKDRNGDGERDYGPYSTDPRENALVLQAGSGANKYVSPCSSDPAYKDAPGAFGWLHEDAVTSNQCEADILDGNYLTDPGANASSDCRSVLYNAWKSGKDGDPQPLYIPVYTSFANSGSKVGYTLEGFAAFVVTGYSLTSGEDQVSWITGKTFKQVSSLGGNPKGIMGYFTKDLVPDAGELGGIDRGVRVVTQVR